MFIPCPFLFAGIRTLISTFGNRTLSGRATSDETIRSCSPVSGIGCRCNFLSLLKVLSVGAMSQHATQIPYLTISKEPSARHLFLPGMRHSAEPPHKTWPPGFRLPSKKRSASPLRNSSSILSPPSVLSNSNTFRPCSTDM